MINSSNDYNRLKSMRMKSYRQLKKEIIYPKDKPDIVEWAHSNIIIPKQDSFEHGVYDKHTASYQIEMLRALCDPKWKQVVFMTGTQLGKTLTYTIYLSYLINFNPCSIILAFPDEFLARTFSVTKLDTFFSSNKKTSNRVFNFGVNNRKDNTIFFKSFIGGHISLLTATAPKKMVMRSAKILIADEVDQFPFASENQGNPLDLLKRRVATHRDAKVVFSGSPTEETNSQINFYYTNSTRGKYLVPCPKCGHKQELLIENFMGLENVEGGDFSNTSVYFQCTKCESRIYEESKREMVSKGEWVFEGDNPDSIGFNISEFYSPWVSWVEIMKDFILSQKDPEKSRVFTMTRLAKPFKQKHDEMDVVNIIAKHNNFEKNKLPENEKGVLIAGCDIQSNRIEIEIKFIYGNNQIRTIDYRVLHGVPYNEDVWIKLDGIMNEKWVDFEGYEHELRFLAIDSGYLPEYVYNFSENYGDRVMVVKGQSTFSHMPVNIRRLTTDQGQTIRLHLLDTHRLKDMLFAHMKHTEKGDPGYFEFNSSFGLEYFEQLFSEYRTFVHEKNRYRWKKVSSSRKNEVLDINIYCLSIIVFKKLGTVSAVKKQKQEKIVHIPFT